MFIHRQALLQGHPARIHEGNPTEFIYITYLLGPLRGFVLFAIMLTSPRINAYLRLLHVVYF
jgi:hypothetical protein